MQPRFALRITDDGLALYDRAPDGWVEVGTTVFDRPDLDAAVGALAANAAARAPEGFATLLVLPDSQILYTQVEDAGGDAATQRERIRTALDGRTPYDVTDLVFDWTMAGTTAHVAVVARETLDEAEAFAAGKGLNPVGFAASPDAALYPALPFFGPTALSATLLTRGETLERETAPIVARPQDDAVADVVPETAEEAPVAEVVAEPVAEVEAACAR